MIATYDDEDLPPLERRAQLGHARSVKQQIALTAKELHGVCGERLELHGEPGARLGHRCGHGLDRLHRALGDRPLAEIDGVVVEEQDVALAHL